MKIDLEVLVNDAIDAAQQAIGKSEFYRAEALLKQIQKVGHTSPDIEHMLGFSLHRQGKNGEAKDVLEPLVADHPDNWEFQNSLGVVYSNLREPDAVERFVQAAKLNTESIIPQNNLALQYQAAGCYREARVVLEKAIASKPEHRPMLWFNLANVYLDELQPDKAILYFRKATEAKPDFHAARWNLAAALLMAKDYEKGWEEYESRWEQFPNFAKLKSRFLGCSAWEGEDLDGKTILLYAEQGAGDAIQFVRFTQHLKERGATTFLEWVNHYERGDLVMILDELPWVDRLIDPTEETIYKDYDFDYHQSLASLPRVLKIHIEDDLWRGPYIQPNTIFAPELDEQYWQPYEGKKKVGIVWGGSPSHHNDPKRSYPADRFAIFADDDIQLFSLQKDRRKRNWPGFGIVDLAEGVNDLPIVDLSPMMTDFNVTANLVSQMDLIISVDTAVAHLAGAMGKPTFLILPKVPDWRWGTEGDKTPWYPTMRLFREEHGGDHFAKAVTAMRHLLV